MILFIIIQKKYINIANDAFWSAHWVRSCDHFTHQHAFFAAINLSHSPSPHLYLYLRRGTAPPGRFPATQHLHHNLQRVKTQPQHDRAPNGGGGDMQGGAGDTEGANGWAYKVRLSFFKFLLFTDYQLQLPHLPNTKNATHSHVFHVRRLVTYRYIIAPARDSNRSRGIHSPLRGPNFRYAYLLPVTLLFRSFPLLFTCPIVSLFPSFPLSRASIVHGPLYLVS